MPVILQPITASLLTRDEVRRFLRDYPGEVPGTGRLNLLLDNVEFSDDDIASAEAVMIDYYNVMTPIIGVFNVSNIPKVILLYGVASHLLKSSSIFLERNNGVVQDGDVQPIGMDQNSSAFMALANQLFATFNELAQRQKIQKNMSAAYGGLSSGYTNVSRNHHA